MSGLKVSADDLKELTKVDKEGWKAEIPLIKEHYATFGDKLPQGLKEELAALETMLREMPKHKGTDHLQADIKRRIKELTGRSRGISMKCRLTDFARYVRGWVGYFGVASQFEDIANLDGWIRRRIRMCYWKQWRLPRTKVKNLVALGVSLDLAIKHAVSRKKYWRMSRTPALRIAMTNEWLKQQGLVSLKQLWYERASLRGTA